MKIILLLFTIILSSCGGTWNNNSLAMAQELCKPNGGLKHISIYVNRYAICNNGAELSIHDIQRAIEVSRSNAN